MYYVPSYLPWFARDFSVILISLIEFMLVCQWTILLYLYNCAYLLLSIKDHLRK